MNQALKEVDLLEKREMKHMGYPLGGLKTPPGFPLKQKKKGKDFQTACQHIEYKDQFGKYRKTAEIPYGTYHFKSRTNIV